MDEFPPPEAPNPPRDRVRHPFHMHEMMRRAPVSARTTLTAVREAPLPTLPDHGRVLFTGIGTSFHAALGAARAAQAEAPGPLRHAVAVPAFELRNRPAGLDDVSLVVAFSASGETDVTRRAVRRFRDARVPVLAVCASEKAPLAAEADASFTTRYADEASFCHTVSYTAALVAATGLLARWTDADDARWNALDEIPDALTSALACENSLIDRAERLAERPRWLLVGSGFRAPTVREGALKLREAAARFTATVGVEELLHGPLASVDDKTVVVFLTGTPLETARAAQGLAAIAELGAETFHFDSTPGPAGPATWTTQPLPGALSPIVDIVPFWVMAYWMSVVSGSNPDAIGYDDARHRAARGHYGL